MHQSLKIFLIAAMLFPACLTSSGDTLTYNDNKVSITGKIIQQNPKTVKFAINFFKKTTKGFSPIILTEKTENVNAVKKKYEPKVTFSNDPTIRKIQKLSEFALLKIHKCEYSQAFSYFKNAKEVFEKLPNDRQEKNPELQSIIYQGLLRFKLLDFLDIIDNPKNFQKSKDSIKPYAIAANIGSELLDYLQLKLNNSILINKKLIQNVLRTAIKIYRVNYREQLILLSQNETNQKTKVIRDQVDKNLANLREIFTQPQTIDAMQGMLRLKNILKSKNSITRLSSKLEKAELIKFSEFFKSSVATELMQVIELDKLRKLFDFWFPEGEKSSKYRDFTTKIQKIETIWNKSINSKNVSQILNADIIQYRKELEEILDEGISELAPKEAELLKLINQHRELFGLNPLINKPADLVVSAKKYLRILAKMDKISHIGSDGSTPLIRAQKEGWQTQNIAENLYRAETKNISPRNVFNAWLSKPFHSLNIINPGFDCCGIAAANTDWILILAGP